MHTEVERVIRKALLVVTLGVAGTTGLAMAHHSPTFAHKTSAAVVAGHAVAAGTDVSDPDANAPCVTTAAGEQTGNCADSNQQGGGQDSQQNGADSSDGDVTSPDGDNIQSGPQ
jgi:hypothetical protein